MAHVPLTVTTRTELGTPATRRIRRQGLVPGVLYQAGSPSIPFSVPGRDVRRLMHGEGGRNAVIDLSVDDDAPLPALLKDWQLDPVREEVTHIDLQQVDLREATEAEVLVSLVGTAVGVRDGGVLDQPLRTVTVRALPDAIPERIEFDVTALGAGDALHVSDLVAPEGVEILGDPGAVVASVTTPTGELEEEVEETEEPELIGGREDSEE